MENTVAKIIAGIALLVLFGIFAVIPVLWPLLAVVLIGGGIYKECKGR